MRVDIDTSGPMFDGRASRAARDFTEASELEVAEQGADMIRAELKSVLRHPTGNYMSHISVRTETINHVVTDRGIVYGPWLEGTGSRNRTTRFKGYSVFRRTLQKLDRKAGSIAEKVLPAFLRRMS